jgi:Protein of unknown function (DUF2846)
MPSFRRPKDGQWRSYLRTILALSRRLLRAGAGSALLATAACSQLPTTASVAVPPIPAGEARVWFYRDEGPYESRVRPGVRMNDAVVGEVEPRGAFYRDTPPGRYRVAVDSYVPNPNAARDINLDPGQQAYFKIVSEDYPLAGGGLTSDVGASRPAFQLWLMPDGWAQREIARSPFNGGS